MNSTTTGKSGPKSIFLADDDQDDCLLFKDALKEVCQETELVTAHDGMELMKKLDESVPPPPDVIFLDLNMPKKNGFECLNEIRDTTRFKNIPVVIFSTSSSDLSINKSYDFGANHYICKPGSFVQLKLVIKNILSINWNENMPASGKDKFVLRFQ